MEESERGKAGHTDVEGRRGRGGSRPVALSCQKVCAPKYQQAFSLAPRAGTLPIADRSDRARTPFSKGIVHRPKELRELTCKIVRFDVREPGREAR